MPYNSQFDLRGKKIQDSYTQVLQYDTSSGTSYTGQGSSVNISASYAPSISSSYTTTASFAVSASWAPFTDTTGTTLVTASTYPITSSWAVSASWAPDQTVTVNSASWASQSFTSTSSSLTKTASYVLGSDVFGVVASATNADFASQAILADSATNAEFATTTAYADDAGSAGNAAQLGNTSNLAIVFDNQKWNFRAPLSGSIISASIIYINTKNNLSSSALIISQSTPVSQSFPIMDLISIWSGSTSTVYTGIKYNVIDSGSSSSSRLLDIVKNYISLLTVFSTPGNVSFGGGGAGAWGTVSNSVTVTMGRINGLFGTMDSGTEILEWRSNDNNLAVRNNLSLGTTYAARDTILVRDLARTLALRGAGTVSLPESQSFRIYNFYSASGAQFERANHYWSGSNYYISTEQSGSGLPRDIVFQTSGSTRLVISGSGTVDIRGGELRFQNNSQSIYPYAGGLRFDSGGIAQALINAGSIYVASVSLGGGFGITAIATFDNSTSGRNAVSIRNGGTSSSLAPQALHIANYHASTTNFERACHYWSGSTYYITTEQTGSGRGRSIAFQTTGSTRLYISSSGNIGVGTSTPFNSLDVVGNISCSVITASFNGTSSYSYTSSFIRDTQIYFPLGTENTSNVTINFNSTASVLTMSITADTSFVTSNKTANIAKTITYVMSGDTVDRNLTFEGGWNWFVTTPTIITANKKALLTLTCVGTSVTDVYVTYKESI